MVELGKRINNMESCYSLSPLGIETYAYSKDQALQIISELRDSCIAILGGDVYCLNNGIIMDSYDNWYCNLEPRESPEHFVERSYFIAKKYIENYQENGSGKPLFSIVSADIGTSSDI